MKYKPYPKYKDSGVEWLGEIPEGWACSRLRFLAKLNPSKTEIIQNHPDEVSFLPMDNIGDDGSLRLDITKGWKEVESGYTYFAEGDVTYAIITPCFENGKGAQMKNLHNKTGFGTTELCVLRPNQDCDGKWLWYITISIPFRKLGESWMYGAGGQKRVPDNFARDFSIGFPPLPTQRAIATFLDTETARIDGLIKDYEELIDLLKEKRQALISHAVTRGLSELVNPDDPEFGEWAKPVKFKDSGVEWIGEIPEGWEVVRLSYFASVENGTTPSRSESGYWTTDDNGIPWLGSGEVNQYNVNNCTERITSDALAKCSLRLLPIGTIILGIVGEGKTRGTSAKLCIEATINQNLAAIIPSEKLDTDYLHYSLQASYSYLREQGRGGNQSALNCEIVSAFRIPFQSIQEQKKIALFLNRNTAKLDALVSESESAIELLKEHRSALITNAVTGKINVENIA